MKIASSALCASMVLFFVLDDRRGLHRRARSARPVLPSCDQLLVRDPPSIGAAHEAFQPVQGMPGHVAFVQPERKIISYYTSYTSHVNINNEKIILTGVKQYGMDTTQSTSMFFQ